MPGHDIIVIGASAGGLSALSRLLGALPGDLPASLFVVLHTSGEGSAMLPELLGANTPLSVKLAEDQERLRTATVYVAPPNVHLLVQSDRLVLSGGPRENLSRPSIDALFRSAAVTHGSRVVGCLLTGTLNDGTAGLDAIKQCGGITIVQSPDEAEYPEMPRIAMANVAVDHVVTIAEMADLLCRLASAEAGPSPPVPELLALEVRALERSLPIGSVQQLGGWSPHTCPECGGPLLERGGEGRYRCLVGHAFSAEALIASVDTVLEATLWAAVRQFEQRALLWRDLANRHRQANRERAAAHAYERAGEAAAQARTLRDHVVSLARTDAEMQQEPSPA